MSLNVWTFDAPISLIGSLLECGKHQITINAKINELSKLNWCTKHDYIYSNYDESSQAPMQIQ